MRYGINTPEGVIPLLYPVMARKKYIPATVHINLLTFALLESLTIPVNSHIVSPVMIENNSTIALGLINPLTTAATNITPVIVLTTKFFCLSLIV